MDTNKLYQIMNGPNTASIFDSCRYTYTSYVKYSLSFEIAEKHISTNEEHDGYYYLPVDVKDFKVTAIEHADKSGNEFILKGTCGITENSAYDFLTYVAHYNAKTRTGDISFEYEK